VSTINSVFPLLSAFLPEGVIVGFCNFAWGLKSKKKKKIGWRKKNVGDLLCPWEGRSFDKCTDKISARIDGWLSGGSSMRRPRSEDPISAPAEILISLFIQSEMFYSHITYSLYSAVLDGKTFT
jgi:hypothetical protein